MTAGGALGGILAAGGFFLLTMGLIGFLRHRKVLTDFRRKYGAVGKDVLLVYSDSPHWKHYIETNWLPRWSGRMVVLNKSKPWSEQQVEVQLWRLEARDVEHTPVVIVVPPKGFPTIIRFWLAFRDFKHGKDARLKEAERRLLVALGEELE